MTALPTYKDLLMRQDAPPGSTWGLFGPDDEVGTLNFIGPEERRAAAACVRRGVAFNLDLPLDAFRIPPARHRGVPRHRIFANSPHHRDDVIDNLYPQGSTQIDGLRHFAHPRHGFYNGMPAERVTEGSPSLGINRYADHGILGRGVLLDVERYLQKTECRTLDHAAGEAFGPDLLDAVASDAGVTLRRGDILLMRTGWLTHYFTRIDDAGRAEVARDLRSPGLVQGHGTLEWLWDHGIAMIASDNAGIEAIPVSPASPFAAEAHSAPGAQALHTGMMHPILIGLMGLALGELWNLDPLAADCAEDGVYDVLTVAKPLNLTGGVGSPANAMAVK